MLDNKLKLADVCQTTLFVNTTNKINNFAVLLRRLFTLRKHCYGFVKILKELEGKKNEQKDKR